MQITCDFGTIIEDVGTSGTFIVSLEKPLVLPDRIIPANDPKPVPIANGTGTIDLVPTQAYGIFYSGFLLVAGRRIWTGRFVVPAAGTGLRLSQALALTPAIEPHTPPPDSAPTALMGFEYTAASTMSALRVVRVQQLDRIEYASNNNRLHAYGVLGILPNAVNQGEKIAPIVQGSITDGAWNWAIESPIYLGIDGQLTQVAPTVGFLLPVATPITPTQINFEIQEAVIL